MMSEPPVHSRSEIKAEASAGNSTRARAWPGSGGAPSEPDYDCSLTSRRRHACMMARGAQRASASILYYYPHKLPHCNMAPMRNALHGCGCAPQMETYMKAVLEEAIEVHRKG